MWNTCDSSIKMYLTSHYGINQLTSDEASDDGECEGGGKTGQLEPSLYPCTAAISCLYTQTHLDLSQLTVTAGSPGREHHVQTEWEERGRGGGRGERERG